MDDREHNEQTGEPELKRPDEAIEDLEPEQEESAAVQGGVKLDSKIDQKV
jgi:hypothetical protein